MHNRFTDQQWCDHHWLGNASRENRFIFRKAAVKTAPGPQTNVHEDPQRSKAIGVGFYISTNHPRGRKIWERPSFILTWNFVPLGIAMRGKQEGHDQEMNTATCLCAGNELKRPFEFFCAMGLQHWSLSIIQKAQPTRTTYIYILTVICIYHTYICSSTYLYPPPNIWRQGAV
jgi:hypothetical protein